MIQLMVGTRVFLYENDEMELVLERAQEALENGIAVQIIPDA